MPRDLVAEAGKSISARAIAALPPWHKKPKDYGRPLVQYVRRAQVRVVWAWRAGTWTPDTPRREASWPTMLPDKELGEDMVFVFAVANLLCATEAETRADLLGMAPWLDTSELRDIMERARKCKSAGRGIGKWIHLTEAERRACRAWHLQAVDGQPPGKA